MMVSFLSQTKIKIQRSTVADKRKGKDRRVNTDRRNGDDSSYNGPEQRGIKYRRSDKDRREKD
jgi:hypothetical protein